MTNFLFLVFPYLAVALAVSVGLYRYFRDRFSYSSLSSQFLEKEQLFWGSVPWHYAILLVLTAHLVAALIPGCWAAFLSEPLRLCVVELTGLALGLTALLGLVVLMARRGGNSRVAVVTTVMDWVLLVALALQVLGGVLIALLYRWGAAWYAQTAAPWLWSLATFRPDMQTIATLPLLVKFHFVNAFVLVALFPFTRLVHLATFPWGYLWRPHQLVIWNRRTRAAESA